MYYQTYLFFKCTFLKYFNYLNVFYDLLDNCFMTQMYCTNLPFWVHFYSQIFYPPLTSVRDPHCFSRGSRIPDLNPCKNTRIRIPDLRIRISNNGSEALFPGRIDPSLSYRHLLNIQCLKPPLLSSIVKLSLCTCLYIFFFMLAFN